VLEAPEEAYEAMIASGLVQFAVGEATVEEIDRINILQRRSSPCAARRGAGRAPDIVLNRR